MAAKIIRTVGILIAASGGILLHAAVTSGRGIEAVLLAVLIFGIGGVLTAAGFLTPRILERTNVVENALGYRLRVDARGEVIITCLRDETEAELLRGELDFDAYAAEVARHEYGLRGDSRRVQLAREHQNGELMTHEYAEELAALAAEISALRDAYAAGELAGDAYEAQLRRLV